MPWLLYSLLGIGAWFGLRKVQAGAALESEAISLLLLQSGSGPAAQAAQAQGTSNVNVSTSFGNIAVDANMNATDQAMLQSALNNTNGQGSAWVSTAAVFNAKGYPLAAYNIATLGMQLIETGKVTKP